MQLFRNRSHYLIIDGEHCLWCSRFDGSLEAKSASSINDAKSLDFLCNVEGVIGKIQLFPDSEPKLVVILAKSTAAQIACEHNIYRIERIGLLPLSPTDPPEGDRILFSGHFDIDSSESSGRSSESLSESNLISVNRGVQKTLKTLRQATNFNIGLRQNRKDRSDREKLERRILEDILKMFNESQSFYYSLAWDLTNSMQRLFKQRKHKSSASEPAAGRPSWHAADDRFFWNRDLWKDLLTNGNMESDHWIVPIIQGYVQMEKLDIDLDSFDSGGQLHSPLGEYCAPVSCRLMLISRRSRFRAGTRYKRRGIDDKGNCANFVETEQVLEIMGHCLSFVQVRGSIPVYWSQPGMRYRPAARLDRTEKDSHTALTEHFTEQMKLYKHQVLINLVEQTGREKILADAYLQGIKAYDSENLVYVSFDFHDYCRGLKLENIGVLIESLQEIFQGMRFFWCKVLNVRDATDEQIMCQQRSVFRVNCVDCLDRTNVIQASLARFVLETQLRKMGLLLPDSEFSSDFKQKLQIIWANNGDIVSRQYAGTSALKGDFTRTGERKFTGLMKDGYTSANRYYLNQFKDAYRQAAVDASLGKFFQEESILVPGLSTSVDPSEFDRVKQLVDDCKRILIPETEIALGGWPMVDADSRTGDPARQDMDTVLLLSTQAYYIGEYSDESDQLVGYQKVPLCEIENIEIGSEMSMFKTGRTIMRINYRVGEVSGYCHNLGTAGLRFFNNMIMPLRTNDECIEMLRSIGESFRMALESQFDIAIPVMYGPLQKKVTKPPPKEAAPHEAEGGIFTAARAVPSSANLHKPHINDLFSVMKNKLAGFNPMHRLHLAQRDSRHQGATSVAFSKNEGRLDVLPSINILSPTTSPAVSEGTTSERSESGGESAGTSPLPDRKTIASIMDSCGMGFPELISTPNFDTSAASPTGRRHSHDSHEKLLDLDTPRRLSMKQRHHSRSSEALEHTLLDLRSPLILSASPSIKAFHDETEGDVPVSVDNVTVVDDEEAPASVAFHINEADSDDELRLVSGSPNATNDNLALSSELAPNSKSNRTCRTRIIAL
ncbi:phosphatidylinositide phosphatase SAC2-like isoform X2 [Paramacrobiotus metropolitanus]|uniref:phosphatidylinositide phosphatase SAC2-like isoform X2 n=1 Tax=Paramacrobiotus metropolitanus TaxID=2943436 RepID=UPI002445A41D|nr:phosphatidylinositide phosphatase SAC2-like isoform X2 [Paramacrobiotus metropolitanus]